MATKSEKSDEITRSTKNWVPAAACPGSIDIKLLPMVTAENHVKSAVPHPNHLENTNTNANTKATNTNTMNLMLLNPVLEVLTLNCYPWSSDHVKNLLPIEWCWNWDENRLGDKKTYWNPEFEFAIIVRQETRNKLKCYLNRDLLPKTEPDAALKGADAQYATLIRIASRMLWIWTITLKMRMLPTKTPNTTDWFLPMHFCLEPNEWLIDPVPTIG